MRLDHETTRTLENVRRPGNSDGTRCGGTDAGRTAPPAGRAEVENRKQLFLDERLFAWKSRVSPYMGQRRETSPESIDRTGLDVGKGTAGGFLGGRSPDQRPVGHVRPGREALQDVVPPLYAARFRGPSLAPCHIARRRQLGETGAGIFDNGGSRVNNILAAYRGSKYFDVFKDPQDPDPARRYKAMGEIEGRGASGAAVAFSPDGRRWTEHPGNPVAPKGREITDSPTLLGWDSRIRKYVYYPRPGFPLAPRINGTGYHKPPQGLNPNVGQLRSIGYSTSDDFVRWSATQLMLAPGELDRADWQYYQMTAAQEGDYYIGLMHMMQTHDQTFDIYLLTSVDGFHWDWVDRRLPFLKRGDIGSYDAATSCHQARSCTTARSGSTMARAQARTVTSLTGSGPIT